MDRAALALSAFRRAFPRATRRALRVQQLDEDRFAVTSRGCGQAEVRFYDDVLELDFAGELVRFHIVDLETADAS